MVSHSTKANKFKRHPLPFRYPGGKYYAMNILRPFFENIEHSEYREPFAGGATVFFNKKKSSFNWLNDLDKELITTYKVMKSVKDRQHLIKLIDSETASKERWREIMGFVPTNNIEIAYKYFYLNRTSFSGKLISPAWGYREKRSLPPQRWHERITPCGLKLQDVKLSSFDFEKVIKHQKQGDGDVLMYVDPPYFLPPKHKHYRHGLTLEDHQRLANALKECNHKFFLTYDDCEEIRDLYSWANIFELKFFYRVHNSNTSNGIRKHGFELIITNFKPDNLDYNE